MPWPVPRRCLLYRKFLVFLVFLVLFASLQILFLKNFRIASQDEDYFADIRVPEGHKRPIPVYWKHPRCGCLREVPKPVPPFKERESSCNQFANLRGLHQKVISYSFYGDTQSGYFKGISVNVESITQLYSGWLVRLYHNISPDDKNGSEDLCDLVCKYSNLDDCYVGDLENQFTDLPSKFGMLWRFLVMGDSTVDVFGCRDLDSPVYQREVDAVSDWLAKNKTWHIMRDNVAHTTVILGGMWGARNDHNLTLMQELRQKILDKGNKHFKSFDQQLLTSIVWPEAKRSMVAHDSYLCRVYKGSDPWPTQRVGRTFVGDMYGLYITKECPPECRPKKHKDWTYC